MDQTITTLDGELKTAQAAALRETLMAALAEGDLRIDTAGVTAADCAVVQVLLSARNSARQLDRNLQIDIAEGGALAQMLDRLALTDAFAAA
jgi:anti-anti-sigma regulatory factor